MSTPNRGFQLGVSAVPCGLSAIVLIALILFPSIATLAALTAFLGSLFILFFGREGLPASGHHRDSGSLTDDGKIQAALDVANKELLCLKEEGARSAQLLKTQITEKVCPHVVFLSGFFSKGSKSHVSFFILKM